MERTIEYIPFSQSLNPPSDNGNLHPEYYFDTSRQV
jgi:hypothetical protein